MSRAGNRQSSIYLGKDGHWHGRVTVGRKDDGGEDRRHVMSKSKATVVAKVRALERLRDEARVPKAGRAWTVEKWLLHWLEEIARPNIRESSYQAYRTATTKHLLPVIGNVRLDRLEPENIEAVYRRMLDAGAKPATAHQVHRTVRTALGEAVRRGHLGRNPAQLVRPPRIQQELVEPFTLEEVQLVLTAAKERRNGARWAIALALGLRQGEALALRWDDIDLEAKSLRVRATRLRPAYAHGCDGACGKAAGYCPQRRQTNAITGATKSAAGNRSSDCPTSSWPSSKNTVGSSSRNGSTPAHSGRRRLGLHHPLRPTDRTQQRLPRMAGPAAARRRTSRPTPRRAPHRGHRAPRSRCPGAHRHVDNGLVKHLHGRRYQHVTDPIRREVANRVDGLLFSEGRDHAN